MYFFVINNNYEDYHINLMHVIFIIVHDLIIFFIIGLVDIIFVVVIDIIIILGYFLDFSNYLFANDPPISSLPILADTISVVLFAIPIT